MKRKIWLLLWATALCSGMESSNPFAALPKPVMKKIMERVIASATKLHDLLDLFVLFHGNHFISELLGKEKSKGIWRWKKQYCVFSREKALRFYGNNRLPEKYLKKMIKKKKLEPSPEPYVYKIQHNLKQLTWRRINGDYLSLIRFCREGNSPAIGQKECGFGDCGHCMLECSLFLHQSAFFKDLGSYLFLLLSFCTPEQVMAYDGKGKTALHYAAQNTNAKGIQLLLDHMKVSSELLHQFVNKLDLHTRKTPLQEAVLNFSEQTPSAETQEQLKESVRLLLANGADQTNKDVLGQTVHNYFCYAYVKDICESYVIP